MKKEQVIALILIEVMLAVMVIARPSIEMILLCIFTQMQLFVNLTAYRIKDALFNGADWLRRTVYFVPYTSAIILFASITSAVEHLLHVMPIAICIGIIFLLPHLNEIKAFYNKDLVIFFPPLTFRQALLEFYSHIFSSIFQELYFKAFVMYLLIPRFGIPIAILASAILFVGDHLVHARSAAFKLPDFLAQFALSICAGLLYVYSGSVWAAVMVHFTFNAPLGVSYLFRYWVRKGNLELN
ncbi:membrane protease YdiL (CAAX protease family) [Fontibacillus solani]|uniref:Membrane protease YdiL (CAAX protease family) n=1 Tax=Fontibacillus solani TaxID=1572857 RepID=A0A7W3SVS8_9BACL|nr:CPBP family intramembrane glutamic endopeptidase [Fontibacillus solani]MBA9086873.1 membrane protease YdiL (CAAX protease family) [Fontibacillus solani]